MGKLLVRKLLDRGVERVVTYSRRWNDSEQLERELDDKRLFTVNGDVRDRERLAEVMNRFMVDAVIHSAAYKSLPSAEKNPSEVMSINYNGTKNVVDMALAHGIKEFCLISTDKACSPSSIYGKSKAMAESYVTSTAVNQYPQSSIAYFSLRYGNVVGSTGSVFEKFKTADVYKITDPSMTRFWFRQNSAAEFVLDSFDRTRGGEVFVPYLSASTMQEFLVSYGLIIPKPYEIIGNRGGEKTAEEMISMNEIDQSVWLSDFGVFAILPNGMSTFHNCIPAREKLDGANSFSSNNTRQYHQLEMIQLIKEYLST